MDEKIDKLNARIAKLLGKRDNKQKLPNKQKSPNQSPLNNDDYHIVNDSAYLIVTLISLIVLWFATGIYYANDGTTAMVYNSGKLTAVVKGPKLGITVPYPFSDIDVVDTRVSDMINLSSNGINYNSITQDDVSINMFTQFSYQITNPVKLYANYVIDQNIVGDVMGKNIENMVRYEIEFILHNVIVAQTYETLASANLTLLGNTIKDMVNSQLSKSGVEVAKVNITKMQQVESVNVASINKSLKSKPETQSSIATELVSQAKSYRADKIEITKNRIKRFNLLLPQYMDNRQAVVEQMYNDALIEVPIEDNNGNKYPLLSKSLAELINMGSLTLNNKLQSDNVGLRAVSRSVDRERDLGQ